MPSKKSTGLAALEINCHTSPNLEGHQPVKHQWFNLNKKFRSSGNMSSIPSSARRTFSAASSAARASSRDDEARDGPPRKLESLSARGLLGTSFEQRVGRTEIVVSGTRARGGGFYCAECDSLHKDSNRYLAHINGRAHLKKLGLSTRARRATLEEVLQAFEVERRRARGEEAPMQKEKSKEPELQEEEKTRAVLGLPVAFGGQ